jgi:hypothetical protein
MVAAIGALLIGMPARVRAQCTTLFTDDFESGDTASWEEGYGGRATVVATRPIAGRYSMSSSFRVMNALGKYVPASTNVRFTVTIDMTGAGLPRTGSTVLTLTSRRTGADLMWLYVSGSTGNYSFGARAFRSASGVDDSGYFPLPGRATVRIEWARTTAGTRSLAVYLDDVLTWSWQAPRTAPEVVDIVYAGNMGGQMIGTGAVLMDDVRVESCTDAPTPDAAVAMPDAAVTMPDAAATMPDAGADESPTLDLAAAPDAAPSSPADLGTTMLPELPPRQAPAPDDAAVAGQVAVDLRVGCACGVGRRAGGTGATMLLPLLLLLVRRYRPRNSRSN